jgi:large subunit ribosomal protein L24
MAQTMKVRKGDVVQILSGKDRGKQGRIIEADPKKRRVLVENMNTVHRHRRPRPMKDSSRMGQTQIQPGGIFELSAPVDVSNVMVVCPTCNRATRVGYEYRDSKDGRRKVRVCRRADCGEVLERSVSRRLDLEKGAQPLAGPRPAIGSRWAKGPVGSMTFDRRRRCPSPIASEMSGGHARLPVSEGGCYGIGAVHSHRLSSRAAKA